MEGLNQITPGSDRNDAIDQCLAGIDRLSHEVKDASSYIPAYDQRSYSQVPLLLNLAHGLRLIFQDGQGTLREAPDNPQFVQPA